MMERMLLSNEMTRLRRLAQYLHEHRHTHRHITVSAVARHRGKRYSLQPGCRGK